MITNISNMEPILSLSELLLFELNFYVYWQYETNGSTKYVT